MKPDNFLSSEIPLEKKSLDQSCGEVFNLHTKAFVEVTAPKVQPDHL